MKVGDIVRRDAVTVAEDDSLHLAGDIMAWSGTRYLPVVRGQALVGMLSERDILAYRVRTGERGDWRQAPVEVAMRSPPTTVDCDESLLEAAHRMAEHRVGSLPVVVGERLVGVISASDLLAVDLATQREARTPATAEEAMTAVPETVRPGEGLVEAAARMSRRGARHLPVVDGDGAVIGMLSEQDVRDAIGDLTRLGSDPRQRTGVASLRVGEVMTRPALIARRGQSVEEVAALFTSGDVSAVPVVDEAGRAIGMVSYVDLVCGLTR